MKCSFIIASVYFHVSFIQFQMRYYEHLQELCIVEKYLGLELFRVSAMLFDSQ